MTGHGVLRRPEFLLTRFDTQTAARCLLLGETATSNRGRDNRVAARRKSASRHPTGAILRSLGQALDHVNGDTRTEEFKERLAWFYLEPMWDYRSHRDLLVSGTQAMREPLFSYHHHASLSLC